MHKLRNFNIKNFETLFCGHTIFLKCGVSMRLLIMFGGEKRNLVEKILHETMKFGIKWKFLEFDKTYIFRVFLGLRG